MMYLEFMKNFFPPIRASSWLLESYRAPEPKNVDFYFLDMMYVEFTKNFLLADSSKLLLFGYFGLLSPKTFDSYFLDMMYVVFMKNFRSREPKNVWLLLSRHDVRRAHEKFSFRRLEQADGC